MTDLNSSIINFEGEAEGRGNDVPQPRSLRREAGQAVMRNAEIVASEINQIKEHVRATAIDGAIRIGRKLHEAKSLVPYGEWEKWLETNVNYSASTAQNLMRIADEYGRKESQALADISYTQAVALLRLPAEEREQFVAEHDMENLSTRDLNAEIKRLNAEREKLQLTLDELLGGDKQENEKAPEPAITMVDEKELAEARTKAEEAEQRARDLEKSLESARKQVAEAEKRREDDLKREAAKAEAAEKEKQKAVAERNAAKKQAEADALKLRRTEEELVEARKAVRTVEVLPENVKQELDRLRAQASRTGAESEMRAAYDGYVAAFERLMGKLADAETADAETAGRFRAAFYRSTLQMAERMNAQ